MQESSFSWAVALIFIMPLYSSLLDFNHFTQIRQTTPWCWNRCVLIALESKGKIQRVEVSTGEEEKEKGTKPTRSFCSVKRFCPFSSLQNTYVPWQNWKPSSNDIMYLHVDCKSYIRARVHPSTGGGGCSLFQLRKMIFNELRFKLYLFHFSWRQ